VLARQPTNEEALIFLAESAVGTNGIAGARRELERVRSMAANTPGFHLAVGTLQVRETNVVAAESSFKQALTLDPKSSGAWVALGNQRWRQGDLPGARQAFGAALESAPIRSQRRMICADFHLQTTNVDEAKRILGETTLKAPDFIPAWTRLSEIAMAEKKYDESASLLQQVLVRDPSNYDALIVRGRNKLARGEVAQAVADLEQVSKGYPEAPQAHYQLAVAQSINNDNAAAVRSLNQALNLNPDFDDATLLLAEVEMRMGNLSSCIVLLTRLIEKHPNLAAARLLLASAQTKRGNLGEALAIYQRMSQDFPGNPELSLLTGSVLLQQGKKAEARLAFERCLQISPDDMGAVEQLTNLDLETKHYDAALLRVRNLIQRNPKRPEPQYILASILMAQRDSQGAEAALLKAIELESNFRPAYFLLARHYLGAGRHQDALKKLEAVVSRDPRDVVAHQQIGMIYTTVKNYEAARNSYEKILAIDSNFSPAINNLAYLYSEQLNQPERAYELARRATELAPGDPSVADTFGWILYKRNDYVRALGVLQGSALKLSGDPEVQFHLGMAYYMMGGDQAARPALQRALQSTNDFTEREAAKERLSVLAIDPATAGSDVRDRLEKLVVVQPHDPVASARLGSIYERDGAFAKAILQFEKVLKSNPESKLAAKRLAILYARTGGDDERANQLGQKARESDREDPELSKALGILAYRRGDDTLAVGLLKESALKRTEDAEVFYFLGIAHHRLKQKAETREALARAVKLNSTADFSKEARRILDELR
jgi:tetratricopeptide (TPR) repeat protein